MTAMQTTAVYACVRILSEAVASLPIHVYRYKDGEKEMVCDHPLYTLLYDEPNPEMTSFDGNWWYKERYPLTCNLWCIYYL